jgi:membrane protein YqaA with SNARE-associated domain
MFLIAYQTFLSHLFAPLFGPWAILLVGIIDSSAFGMPLDAVVAYYVYHDPRRAFLYVLMVSIGSTCGATVPYLLGRTGGEKFLLQRFGENRFRRIRALTERFGALTLFIPAILPPPTPFKLFEFCAGAAGLRYRCFGPAVFAGRIVRFSILSFLVCRVGPRVVGLAPVFIRSHWRAVPLMGAAAVSGWLVLRYWVRWRKVALNARASWRTVRELSS